MLIMEDFTTHKLSLKFETTGKEVELTEKESKELERKFQEFKNKREH